MVLNRKVDEVPCEYVMIQEALLNYISGYVFNVGLIDINYNVKHNRYHMIGGSCAAIIGEYLYVIGLLQAAGVTRELWIPEDFASDLIFLKINSHSTI